MIQQDSLPPGFVLMDEYRVQKLLGSGGFANTYLARDIFLDRNVAIKEYFPRDFAVRAQGYSVGARSTQQHKDYQWGLDRFAHEAKIISKLKHPNIVRAYRVFNALNTAYIVLEFVEGADLEVTLSKRKASIQQAELDWLLQRLLDALSVVHASHILHRDIKPANIFIRRSDGGPVLIDFGASKFAFSEANGTTAAIVSRGYSPQEAYATDAKLQGPWTDIYSLSATIYLMISGRTPPEATERVLGDTLVPMKAMGLSGYRESFLAAVDWGLRIQPDQRPRTVEQWSQALLHGQSPVMLRPVATKRNRWWDRRWLSPTGAIRTPPARAESIPQQAPRGTIAPSQTGPSSLLAKQQSQAVSGQLSASARVHVSSVVPASKTPPPPPTAPAPVMLARGVAPPPRQSSSAVVSSHAASAQAPVPIQVPATHRPDPAIARTGTVVSTSLASQHPPVAPPHISTGSGRAAMQVVTPPSAKLGSGSRTNLPQPQATDNQPPSGIQNRAHSILALAAASLAFAAAAWLLFEATGHNGETTQEKSPVEEREKPYYTRNSPEMEPRSSSRAPWSLNPADTTSPKEPPNRANDDNGPAVPSRASRRERSQTSTSSPENSRSSSAGSPAAPSRMQNSINVPQ